MKHRVEFAKRIANKLNGKQRLVALAFDKKGRLLSVGTNSYTKTHPKQAAFAKLAGCEGKVYLHAEIAAILSSQAHPYSLAIFRFKRNGDLGLAKPCVVCEKAIREYGIKYVEYTT